MPPTEQEIRDMMLSKGISKEKAREELERERRESQKRSLLKFSPATLADAEPGSKYFNEFTVNGDKLFEDHRKTIDHFAELGADTQAAQKKRQEEQRVADEQQRQRALEAVKTKATRNRSFQEEGAAQASSLGNFMPLLPFQQRDQGALAERSRIAARNREFQEKGARHAVVMPLELPKGRSPRLVRLGSLVANAVSRQAGEVPILSGRNTGRQPRIVRPVGRG
jgi:hypothetical protein